MTEDIKNRLVGLGHQFENEIPVLIRKDGRIACECDFLEDGILPTFNKNHDNNCVLSKFLGTIKIVNETAND